VMPRIETICWRVSESVGEKGGMHYEENYFLG
jgi:hypothetical protein